MTGTQTQTDRRGLAWLVASRRRRVLLAVGLVLLGVRAILPSVLRPWLLARADEALVGFVELEDLDLSLLRGGVTLRGLAVHADERPGEAPPVFAARRLWTQISWLALLARTVEVEELELDDFAVHVDRFDAGLRLPRPIESTEPAPEETARDEPTPESPAGRWSIAADAIALRNGRLELVDHTLGREPQTFALTLEDLSARELAVRTGFEDGEPGRIAIDAQLETGTLSLSSWVEPREEGLDVRSTLVLDEVPIAKLRAYLTTFGWSDLAGRLDARIDHHYVTGGVHEVSGEAALADLRIEVPDEPDPALAWKSLGVLVDRVDLVGRHAEIARITSTGAEVGVEPRAEPPLPLLRGPAAQAAPKPAPDADAAEASRTAAAGGASGSDESAWTWRIGAARVEDAVVVLRGGEEPVRLAVEAELGGLSSEPASRAPLSLRVANGPGTLALEGELAPAPLAFAGRLVVRDLALPSLLAPIDAPALFWLRNGALRADLQLALARDLRASGTLGLAAIELDEPSTSKQFRVAWKDLELGIRRLVFRGLMPAPAGADEPTGAARALDVALSRFALASPRVVLTRDAQGLVLPPLQAPAESEATGDRPAQREAASAPAADATASEASGADASGGDGSGPAEAGGRTDAPALAISLGVDDARIRDGGVQLSDRSLEPAYRGTIRSIELRAKGARWPANSIESLELTAEGLRGAHVTLTGALHPEEKTRLELELVELPLEQFQTYLASTGYELRSGALSLASKVELESRKITSDNRLVVSSLSLAGAEGEAAFMENFGIPLSVALGLLEDLDGRITLAVPIEGEPTNMKVGVGGLVVQALRKALIGALSAPLKLLGAVTRNGRIENPNPAPVEFVAGEARLTEDEDERLEEIASLLTSSPGILLRLAGQTAESDDRVFCERALLEQLEASRGIRALSALGELARRRAVREYLAKRLAGGHPEPLAEDDALWLEDQLSRVGAPVESLEALAEQRAEALRDRLVEQYEIDPSRLALDPPRIDPPAPAPGVAISIDANRAPVPAQETTYRPASGRASPEGGAGWEG